MLGNGQRQVGKFADVPTQNEAATMLNISGRSVRNAVIVRDRAKNGAHRLSLHRSQARCKIAQELGIYKLDRAV
jgi:hypothetical protein